MVNRIEIGHSEIIKWKGRFEKLFSAEVINSRAFKLEQLAMYEQLLKNVNRLNREEKVYRKLIRQEKNNLVRALYPNRVFRFIRNTITAGASLIASATRLFSNEPVGQQSKEIIEAINKAGFAELHALLQPKLNNGQTNFKVEQAVSVSEKERINYSLSFSSNDNRVTKLDGFDVKHIRENGEVSNFRFDASTGITRDQASELVHGRAINSYGKIWQMIDFNDKDAAGNYALRQIVIPDFDLEKELSKLPLAAQGDHDKQELVFGLKNGKKMQAEILVNNMAKQVQIEVLPLKRNFQLYEDGKKVSMDKLLGNEADSKKQQLKVAFNGRKSQKQTGMGL